MKKTLLIAALLLLCASSWGKDVYVKPKVVSGDTLKDGGRFYRLWGIQIPEGSWNKAAMAVLEEMTKGMEFKLLVDKKYPGVARFGLYNRSGNRQKNLSVLLLRMGLASFNPHDHPFYEGDAKRFRDAEKFAKEAKIGIWAY